jgi:hypothetical protein
MGIKTLVFRQFLQPSLALYIMARLPVDLISKLKKKENCGKN